MLKFYGNQKDRLSVLIPELRSFLQMSADNPGTSILILIHCQSGLDRTGEVAGAYSVQYLNKTLDEAIAESNSIYPGYVMHPRDVMGLSWYCFYARDVLGIPTRC
jgi:protein-tyrosine phosphatase